MKRILILVVLVSLALGAWAVESRFLNHIAHIRTTPAMNIMAENRQVLVRNTNQLWIYSTFNAWQPRIEASGDIGQAPSRGQHFRRRPE
ncbi:MAG: hypothetical protein V3576_06515, partial [Candidatus Cloacimonadota bacterium]